jgi:hypothetical protein
MLPMDSMDLSDFYDGLSHNSMEIEEKLRSEVCACLFSSAKFQKRTIA